MLDRLLTEAWDNYGFNGLKDEVNRQIISGRKYFDILECLNTVKKDNKMFSLFKSDLIKCLN